MQTADWIIVGAGFAGLTAANRLAELCPDDSIVLIDAQRVGFGAAGRNTGFMIDLPHDLNSDSYTNKREEDLKQIRLNRAAIDYARQMAEEKELGDSFNFCGKYHGAASDKGEKHLQDFARGLESMGEDFSTLTASEMKTLTGSDFYTGGLFTPGAAIIQPAAYVRKLAERLPANVTLYENSPVRSVQPGKNPLVTTDRGSVQGGRVLMTVNGQAESFGFFKGKFLHVFTYGSMTRQLSDAEQKRLGGKDEWALIPADPMGSTVRRIREGRIVVRNTFTYNPDMSTSRKQVERIGKAHDRSFRKRFPMLDDVGMEHRWGGHLCISLNNGHGFGQLEEGIYAGVCQNGIGVAKGTLSGLMLAEEVAGGRHPLLPDFKSCGLPSSLPPLTSLGAPMVMAWRELSAGVEK
ncbi:NAD(P)/FAD-dependent oxidoreductase [Kiloniella sp. b19]|uniref:NAD(P)/FAD-dependent oxidoreductase n=1 Tax=Kiloniella sp. GXU_MW_B19 TaxID=3141326 RepID=UPI0031D0A40F